MSEREPRTGQDRRTFLKAAAGCGALALSGVASRLRAESSVDWSKQIGIQLVMLRDEMAKDVESTLAQVAAIGYRFVNPVGFSGFDAKAYRAILDRHGLSAPHIDLGFSTGPGMEEDLEACQILGSKYAEPAMSGSAQRGPPAAAARPTLTGGRAQPRSGVPRRLRRRPRRRRSAPRRSTTLTAKRPANSASRQSSTTTSNTSNC